MEASFKTLSLLHWRWTKITLKMPKSLYFLWNWRRSFLILIWLVVNHYNLLRANSYHNSISVFWNDVENINHFNFNVAFYLGKWVIQSEGSKYALIANFTTKTIFKALPLFFAPCNVITIETYSWDRQDHGIASVCDFLLFFFVFIQLKITRCSSSIQKLEFASVIFERLFYIYQNWQKLY